MSDLPHVNSFRELLVYQKAKALSKEIFWFRNGFLEKRRSLLPTRFDDARDRSVLKLLRRGQNVFMKNTSSAN